MRALRIMLGSSSALILGILCAATPAFAQEGDSAVNSPSGLIFKIVNSAVVVALFIWGFSKAAPHFRKHADEISGKIAEGTRAREAAERQRQEIQAKLAGLETEVQNLRAAGKREAEGEAQRLREMAKAEAQKIEANAQAEIAAAVRAGKMALKSLTAGKAVAQAEAILRKEITPQSDANLAHKFVAELERSAN
jgi:F-type H+-transporting ATPase subunit b